jgi:hypothetical protein
LGVSYFWLQFLDPRHDALALLGDRAKLIEPKVEMAA